MTSYPEALDAPERRPFQHPATLLVGAAVAGVVGAVVIADVDGAFYWAATLSVMVFFGALSLMRTFTPQPQLLSPRNAAIAMWFFTLVLFPVAVNFVTPPIGTMRGLPSHQAINWAILLNVGAFLAFVLGNHVAETQLPSRSANTDVSLVLIIAFAGVGLIGCALRLRSWSAAISYFTGSGDAYLFNSLDGVGGLLATILPPFLSFAFVLLANRWSVAGKLTRLRSAAILIAVAAPMTLYGYNRAAVAIPLVAMTAALALSGRRRRNTIAVLTLVSVVALAFLFGNSRREITATQGGRYSRSAAGVTDENRPSMWETTSVYGQSPQFAARALSYSPPQRFPGDLLVSSLMSPVPSLGRPFRAYSGTAAYNVVIYGSSSTRDQIVALAVETWWSLGLPGVFVVFFLVGLLLGFANRRFLAARSVVAMYVAMVPGMWLAFAPALSPLVLAQIFVFFMWPQVAWSMLGSASGRRPA